MRLDIEEIKVIKSAVQAFDPSARIFLFGSRTDDSAGGGDIDLLILSSNLTFEDKIKIKSNIFYTLEEQKIDIVIARDLENPFVRLAFNSGVPL